MEVILVGLTGNPVLDILLWILIIVVIVAVIRSFIWRP
jgi:hypothetical protein